MGFSEFIGNPSAVAVVRTMLASNAVPGSLLFSGPEGVGKKTLAMMLAKALDCERLNDDFCNECAHCRKIQDMLALASADLAGRREMKDSVRRVDGLVYFDVQLIEPITRYILIDQIRELRRVAYSRPFELAHRVFIVDQAQAIHWQAVDLLLKVMEEPPPDTSIILVCPNPDELRATLRSRCQQLPFLPGDDQQIERLLRQENRVDQAQLPLAVRVAGGSVAAAKTLDLAEFERRRQPWIDFLAAITANTGGAPSASAWKAVFDAARSLTADRRNQDETLSIGYSLLSDMLQLLEDGRQQRVTNFDLEPQLRKWSAKLGLDGIDRLKSAIDEARRLEVRNVNQQLGWEMLAAELLRAE